MRTITVIGSVNMDLIVYGDRLPQEGETLTGGTFRTLPGGKGANQAVAASKLGARVRFVGCVGDDDFGRSAKENLVRHGIDVSQLRTVDDPTGVAVIMVDRGGRNLISAATGANAHIRSKGHCDIAVMQLEAPFKRPRARFLILNPAPPVSVPLRGVDVVIPNEIEAERLTGERDAAKAAESLVRMGAKRAIITLGEKGCYDGGYRPAFKVKVVDTVGAGDSFVGAFAAGVALGLRDPVLFALAASALKCTRPGAQAGPTRKEAEGFMRERRDRFPSPKPLDA